jgi:hypothetical protein
MQAIAMYDNWEYQYHGQWWDMGSLGWTIFAAFFPFIFFSFMYLQNVLALNYHLSSTANI